jgi:hypothetical protein
VVWVVTYKRRLFGYDEAVRSLWKGNHREILLFAGDRERKQREQSFGRESKQGSIICCFALLCFASGMDFLRCALCGEPAALHCERDDAFLCWPCDTSVHSHNSIVVRHTRSVLCSTCNAPTRFRTSGGSPSPFTCLCAECSPAVCDGAAAANNVCRHLINNNYNDVSDRMSSTSCGAAAAAEAEQGRRRHGAAASPPRPAIRFVKTKELQQQQQQASCAEELGNDGLLCPQEVRRRRRRTLRHASGRYRKAPRHSSRRWLKDPRFTIQ